MPYFRVPFLFEPTLQSESLEQANGTDIVVSPLCLSFRSRKVKVVVSLLCHLEPSLD